MGNVSPSNEPALEVTAMTLDRALFAAFHETRVPDAIHGRNIPRRTVGIEWLELVAVALERTGARHIPSLHIRDVGKFDMLVDGEMGGLHAGQRTTRGRTRLEQVPNELHLGAVDGEETSEAVPHLGRKLAAPEECVQFPHELAALLGKVEGGRNLRTASGVLQGHVTEQRLSSSIAVLVNVHILQLKLAGELIELPVELLVSRKRDIRADFGIPVPDNQGGNEGIGKLGPVRIGKCGLELRSIL